VPSPVRQASSSEKFARPFPDASALNLRRGESPAVHDARGLTALSFEFVAKPEKAARAPGSLSAEIHSALEDVSGFAGGLVMVSDQEARLITVIIFWEACETRRSSTLCIRRVRGLIAPYLDRCLRFQTMMAHTHVPRVLPVETNSATAGFIIKENIGQETNVCLA
jgi:hypothetical protein